MKLIIRLLLVIVISCSFIAKANNVYQVTPDVASCRPGVLTEAEIQKVVDRVNFIRSLHKLSPVVYEHSGSEMSMEGCLNIVASGQGGHVDAPGSECYTPGGGEARMKSNLHQGWGQSPINHPSISSIDGWMIDNHSSNPDKVGHRRAIINPFLKRFAFGRAEGQTKDGSQYMQAMSFLYQDYVSGSTQDNIDYIAYPYENYPTELVDKSFYLSFSAIYNRSGAFSNGNVDFSGTQITVTDENGTNMTVHSITSDLEGWGSLPNNISFKVNGLQDDIKYDVEINNVIAGGQSRNYAYWFRITDIISSEPPAIPVVLLPEDNAIDTKTTPSFTWENTQFASSYEINIASDNGFNDIVAEKSNIMSTSFVPESPLEFETQYFWRLRAKNQNGVSDWTTVRTFTTGKPAPDMVAIAYPEDGEEDVSTTPELKWFAVDNALTYKLELWNNIDMMGWPTISESGISDTTYTIDEFNELDMDTEYFWRVNAANNSGEAGWTPLYSFTTGDGTSVISRGDNIGLKTAPNPFSESCYISFTTDNTQEVSFEVYDITGNKVYSRYIGYLTAGENTILYAPETESGVFIFRIIAGDNVYQDKLIFSK